MDFERDATHLKTLDVVLAPSLAFFSLPRDLRMFLVVHCN